MTDTNKIKAWAFPFKTAGDASKEITDPQLYYGALAKAKSGFYPMGANGLWHGGVHFDTGTAALLDQSAVRCIADGEVIAYRIDEQYPESEYSNEVPLIKHAPFSTGFVLVKHRLELPPVPTAAPVTPAVAAEALTFYSLYMHLLDWKSYQAQTALARPNFWGEGLYQVKTSATDKVLGLNVRAHYKVPEDHEAYGAYKTILATLPRGTTLEATEASPDGKWLKLVSVTPVATGLAPATGWVYKGEMKSLGGNRFLIADKAADAPTTPQQGLNIHAAADQNSDTLAVLPHGTQIKISSEGAVGKYRKLVAIVSGEPVPTLTAGEGGSLPGFVWLDLLEAKSQPKAKDSVVVLETPATINAGELIGHLGQYQNHNDSASKALLHLEVFSCEDVPAFIAKSRARASSLPAAQKTLLKIHPDTKLITHAEGMSATNPPKVSDPGQTIGVTRIIPLAVLNSLPADRKIQTSTPMAGGPAVITNWWRLSDEFADKDGNLISGWLADIIPTRHSPWEWEGFDFISETVCAADQFACHLDAQRLLSEVGLTDYQAQISTADNGPVKTRLYDIIDGADGTTRDDKLTTEEIRAALGKPWHAQSISQLITHYESEWFWKAAKWDELDKLMEHTLEDPNPNWVSEKQRIQKLSWWKQLAGQHGISEDGKCWHLHTPMLIANFTTKTKSICTKCKKNISLTYELMKRICPSATTEDFIKDFVLHAGKLFEKYEVNSCSQVTHLLAQAKHETKRFTAFRESLYYSSYTAQSLYDMAPTAINHGFTRKGLTFPNHAEKLQYIENHLLKNDAGYGQHCFGSNEYPDNDYRGRGLLHLTHYTNYHACALAIGKPIDAEPTLVQSDMAVIIETGLWFWKTNNLKTHAENTGLTEEEAVEKITRIINGGNKGLAERKQFKREITDVFIELYGNCSA